jgi:mono/diheme cytochrome c family protein
MKRNFILMVAAPLLGVIFLLPSCESDPDSPGKEFMPDMYRSPAIEAYVDYGEIRGRENKELKSKLSARQTPKYTIPFVGTDEVLVKMMMPNRYKAGMAWRESHGLYGWDLSEESEYEMTRNNTVNPYTMTTENADRILSEGKTLYTSMCMHCHGEKGDGNGPMIQSGAYGDLGVVPAYKSLDTLSEGKIFHSIYYGKGYMGAHGSLLNKKEIWTLVHYVRQFQFDDYGKEEEVVEEDSEELGEATESLETEEGDTK